MIPSLFDYTLLGLVSAAMHLFPRTGGLETCEKWGWMPPQLV